MFKFLTRFSALMAVLTMLVLPLDAFAIRPRYQVSRVNTSRPAFERLVRGLSPTMDIRPGKSTTTDLESIRVNQIDSTIGSVSFTQGTDANKPLLTEGGRRENIRVGSTMLDNTTYWEVDDLTVTAGQADPFGGTNAVLTSTVNSSRHFLRAQTAVQANQPAESIRHSVYYKFGAAGTGIFLGTQSGTWDGIYIGRTTPTVVGDTNNVTNASIESIGDDWYRATWYITGTGGVSNLVMGNNATGTASHGPGSYSNDGDEVTYFAPQSQRASMSPTYIPTNTLPRHGSLTGQRGLYFDGSNDAMSSTSTLADIVTTTAKEFFIVSTPFTPTANGGRVLQDANTALAILNNNTPNIGLYHDDGGADAHYITFTENAPGVVGIRHDGTNIYTLSNEVAETSLASGSTSPAMTGALTFGNRAALDRTWYGTIDRFTTFNKNPGTSTRQRLIKGFKRVYRVN